MQKFNLFMILFTCAIFLHIGCSTPNMGDRPSDGSCPIGEVCSGALQRLFFSGAQLGDALVISETPPYPIAVGGTQNIKVWRDSGASQPFSAPLDMPNTTTVICKGRDNTPLAFCAFDGGLGVLSASPDPPRVKVAGLVAGRDELRITAPSVPSDAAPDQLYDRILLDVAAPDDIHVVTPPDLDFVLVHGDRVHNMPIAFAVNSQPPAVVLGMLAPLGGEVQRLVDESQMLTLDGTMGVTQSRWDSLMLSHPLDKDITITITGHGLPDHSVTRGTVTIKVVDAATSVEIAHKNHLVNGKSLVVGTPAEVCFSPVVNIDGAQHLIYGAKLKITSNDVQVDPYTNTNSPREVDSCATLLATTPGTATIQVSYGNQISVPLNVCSSSGCGMAAVAGQ